MGGLSEFWQIPLAHLSGHPITLGPTTLGLICLILGPFICQKIVRRIFNLLIKARLSEAYAKKIQRFIFFIMIMAVVFVALYLANIPLDRVINKVAKGLGLFHQIWNYQILAIDTNPITIGSLSIGLALLALGFYACQAISKRVVRKALSNLELEKGPLHTLETVIFYLLLIIVTLFSLKIANIPITIFTVLGGAFAIGIGFGSQNIVNNFISGLIMMVERPIQVGDFIEIDQTFGQIHDIGMRKTTVVSTGNRNIIVPNSFFLDKKVINWTHLDKVVRLELTVGVAYGEDVRMVEKLLLECLKEEPRVLSSQHNFVLFSDFGDNALIFNLNYWIQLKNVIDEEQVSSNLRFLIYQKLNQANITIAFPQRDVHLFTKNPVAVTMVPENRGA